MAKKTTSTEHSTHEGLKSLHLEIENFKNIDKTVIDINGQSMLIFGKNGSGKSSLIQAMTSPMYSKLLPTEPVKKGEERARIAHKIGGTLHGEYKEYTMEMFFSDKNKKGTLTILNEKGEKISSPATTIKNIIGHVSFDIMGWMTAKKDKRLEILKELTGRREELDTIARDIKARKDDRKYKSDRADQLEGALKNHEFSAADIDKYSQPADMSAIQQQYEQVIQAQQQWDGIKAKLDGFYPAVEQSQKNITRAESEINRLQSLIEEQMNVINRERESLQKNQTNIVKGEEWVRFNPRPVTDHITAQMNEVVAHNEKFNRIGMLGGQQKEMLSLKQEVMDIKAEIEALEDKRNKVISESQLPVEGLSFSDEDIFLNGLPLESEQINTAKLMDIGVEIAMALNPKLKVIFINDGSMLDQESLHSVIRKVEERGFMAVVELVGQSDSPEIVFTEQKI